ncbi:MAG TPA: redoxin domain-containing protein, partial [Bacteroidota bacterium]|nr:redoxin domain-containing protein [Bacteroidota bacterium]
ERMTIQDIMPQTDRARELLGDFWFNSGPVPLAALRGQVVLLFFWDYSCAGCLRMLPYVTEWEKRYQPFGLVTVGVHSPRFTFGKKPEHVQKAVARHAIGFPVVMDNEGLIALQYQCRILPEIILVDKDGFIRYRSTGEGNAAAVEHALQALLYSAGVGAELPVIMDPLREADRSGAMCFRATPELFAGYLRGTIGNVEGYAPESVLSYADPGMYLDGRLYADGEWRSERECLRLTGGPSREGHLLAGYQGLDVQGVLEPEGEKRAEITVRQDNEFLSSNRGDDIRLDRRGRSYVVVDEPRLYSLVRNREYGEHVIRLSGGKHRFAVYAFAFATGVIPELVSNN